MSIINSLKTFSKKAFNVEPKGSNIDEVLDDMASKVTPGGSGGDGSGGGSITIVHIVEENDGSRLDKTWRELDDIKNDGTVIFLQNVSAGANKEIYLYHLSYTYTNGSSDPYGVVFLNVTNMEDSSTNNKIAFTSPTEDGYPFRPKLAI